jgi:hypothetical protein
VKCTDCRGKGRFYNPDVVGDRGFACLTCSGTGRVPFDTVTHDGMHQAGYALALHGSLAKDLDVLAAPWTAAAVSAEELVRVICEAAGGFVDPHGPKAQPHGRWSWAIHLGSTGGYVDLSVMPRGSP